MKPRKNTPNKSKVVKSSPTKSAKSTGPSSPVVLKESLGVSDLNFFNLKPENLSDYVRENREFAGTWIFQHIPKTAGSSLVAELSVNCTPYYNISPVYSEAASSYKEMMRAVVTDFVAQLKDSESNKAASIRAASGHLAPVHLGLIKRDLPDLRYFTFLRSPFSRMVSEYSYSCSSAHPPHEEFKRRYPTLEDFAKEPEEQNKLSFFMVEDRSMPADDALALISKSYRMIGLQERYPVSYLLMSSMLWAPALPSFRERVGKSDAASSVPDHVRKYIYETNTLDMALYTATAKVYERIADAIWSNFQPMPLS